MTEMAWRHWVSLLALVVVPLPAMLLGIVGVNMATVAALGIVWLVWPKVGALVYTAMWVNLIAHRIVLGARMRVTLPMTVNNQNGASAWLMILGVIGAIRSGIAYDGLGIALGAIGDAVLFLSQGPLFQPAQ